MRLAFLLLTCGGVTALLGAAAPPLLPAAAASFEGRWLGTVTAPHSRTEIGFAFRRDHEKLLTTFHLPAMFVWSQPLGPAQLAGDELLFEPLNTRLHRDGNRLVGTFGLSHLPVELHRAEAFPARPPEPPPPPAAPPPIWSVKLEGELWGTPTTRDALAYLGTSTGRCYALDTATGAIRWHWAGPHPIFGAALVTAELVLFLDDHQRLVALRRSDGTAAWEVALSDPAHAPAAPTRDETYNHRTAAPILVGDTCYVGSPNGGIYSLDPSTGRVHWRHNAGIKIYTTAGVDATHGHLLFAGFDGTLLVFDPRERRELRRTTLPGPLTTTPVTVAATTVVGCRDYTLYGLGREELAVIWRHSFWFSWIESTPAVADGLLYVGGSDFARITALHPATGQAAWSTIVHGLTWGTPLVTADTVFAGTSAQRGAIIAHTGGVVALDRETGAIRWRHPLPLSEGAPRAGVLGSLARAGDLVIAATFDGTVLAFPLNRAERPARASAPGSRAITSPAPDTSAP